MKKFISKISSEKGQGMVEYGLIIAVIAIVVLVALTPVGTALSQVFTNITTSISGV
ncbi:MAG: Flp family type IVb pilin [Ignavibacteriales bacterium]